MESAFELYLKSLEIAQEHVDRYRTQVESYESHINNFNIKDPCVKPIENCARDLCATRTVHKNIVNTLDISTSYLIDFMKNNEDLLDVAYIHLLGFKIGNKKQRKVLETDFVNLVEDYLEIVKTEESEELFESLIYSDEKKDDKSYVIMKIQYNRIKITNNYRRLIGKEAKLLILAFEKGLYDLENDAIFPDYYEDIFSDKEEVDLSYIR